MDTLNIFETSIPISNIKTWIEILAYLSAAIFFIYKILAGFLFTCLNIGIENERQRNDENYDYLVLKINLSGGEMKAMILKTVCFKISYIDDSEKPIFLYIGINNAEGLNKENWYETKKIKYYISPKEKTNFSYVVKVRKGKVCKSEVIVLGQNSISIFKNYIQWRASCISLPIEDKKLSS